MRSEAEVAAMACPICRVPLAMSDRAGIEIDYCPQCRGVWLDRGELDKIIERSAAEAAPAAAAPQSATPTSAPTSGPNPGYAPPPPAYGHDPRYDPRHGHDPRYRHKRKKSWLEDIFD
jgi:uncharacterized protein